MKAYFLLAPLAAATLVGCTFERVYPTTPVAAAPAVVTPAVVTPTYVTPAVPAAVDSDGDGYADNVDRYPNDARFH